MASRSSSAITARHGDCTAIDERDGLLLVSGSHPAPGPYGNFAMRLTERLTVSAILERADAFSKPKKRSYVLWVREHADEDLDALAVSGAVGCR